MWRKLSTRKGVFMKTYRMIAALLAIVMLLGVFAGCSKNSDNTTDPANPGSSTGTKTETNDEKAASTSKYTYQAEFLPIPDNIQYVNTSTISGSNLYFTGSIIDGKKTARRCSGWTSKPATARS